MFRFHCNDSSDGCARRAGRFLVSMLAEAEITVRDRPAEKPTYPFV
jgi:hypothetical protein